MCYIHKLLALFCGCTTVYSFVIPCLPDDPTAELAFVDPLDPQGLQGSIYPVKIYINSLRTFTLTCCGTGFITVNWYLDGEALGPERFVEGGDSLRYGPDKQSVTLVRKNGLIDKHTFTCELVSDNGTVLSHDTRYFGQEPSPPVGVPYFTSYPKDACVDPGSDVVVTSELVYPDTFTCSAYLSLCKLNIAFQNGSYLHLNKVVEKQHYRHTENGSITVNITVTFTSITEEYLNQNYSIVLLSHPWLEPTVKFQIQSSDICNPDDGIRNVTEITFTFNTDNEDVVISCTVVGVVVILALLAFALSQYEVRLWIKVNLLHKLHKPDSSLKSYHFYVIASESSLALTFDEICDLESQGLKFCLPQRDFSVGAVIPNEIAYSIQSSSYVLALLSNDMFTENGWSDVALSLSISLRKPLVLVIMEKLNPENLKKRRDTRAALKVFKTIKLTAGSSETKLSDVCQAEMDVIKRGIYEKLHSLPI